MKDLYSESYKKQMKDIKEDTNTQKSILCLWTGRIIIVQMVKVPKVTDRVSAISIKIPKAFFKELKQII